MSFFLPSLSLAFSPFSSSLSRFSNPLTFLLASNWPRSFSACGDLRAFRERKNGVRTERERKTKSSNEEEGGDGQQTG